MLKPAEMKGFRAVIPQSKREKVLSALHEAGVVQFRELTKTEVEREEVEKEFYEISSVLGKVKEFQEFFQTESSGQSAEVQAGTTEEILELSRELRNELEPKYKELSSKRGELEEKMEEARKQRETISSLKEVEVPLNYLRSTKRIDVTVGKIKEEELDDFIESINEALPSVFVASSGSGETRIVVVACLRECIPDLRPFLYKHDVESLELPPFEGTPQKTLEYLDKRIAELQGEKESLNEEIEKLGKEKAPEVNTLTELLEIERERQECLPLFGRTDSTTIIEGWSPEEELQRAREALQKATDDVYIMRTYEPKGPDVGKTPVKLENPRVGEDFEYITKMYGLPRYDATDPTLLVAISFSIFFGFCLSDAGYGVMVLAFFLSGLALVRGMFSKRLKRIMIISAIATIVIGSLFGSWFGPQLGEQISVFSPQWIDPVGNPIPFLKLVVFVGIIQLTIGYGLAGGRKDIIRGNWKGVIFNDIGNSLLTIGLFLLIFCILGMGLYEFGIDYQFPELELFAAFSPLSSGPGLVPIFKLIFYTGLIFVVLDKLLARDVPPMKKIGGAVDAVYSIIGLVSNAASYTRLLALGVATSVIAFVINYIGFMFFNAMFPATFSGPMSYVLAIFGVVVLVLILVFGHAFNIFINSITGFVHTMRLHYAEFFETFYESGGKEYNPFKLIRKFT